MAKNRPKRKSSPRPNPESNPSPANLRSRDDRTDSTIGKVSDTESNSGDAEPQPRPTLPFKKRKGLLVAMIVLFFAWLGILVYLAMKVNSVSGS